MSRRGIKAMSNVHEPYYDDEMLYNVANHRMSASEPLTGAFSITWATAFQRIVRASHY